MWIKNRLTVMRWFWCPCCTILPPGEMFAIPKRGGGTPGGNGGGGSGGGAECSGGAVGGPGGGMFIMGWCCIVELTPLWGL